ncbi:MAG: pirin family protein, partial [Chloroflexota bacterium]|nr:pirin family protein [Chloroflexota bacterium]
MPTTLRPADTRGITNIDWLDSRHSFSFSHYLDPERMNFSVLR